MPTGYTDGINASTSFKEFAMKCARAFGALIEMRDDATDAPIPEEFKVGNFYYDSVKRSEAEVARLTKMTETQKKAGALKAFADATKSYAHRIEESNSKRRQYSRMLNKVESWEPPSDDYQGMKDFMIEQLTSSIKYDCIDEKDEGSYYNKKPVLETPKNWWTKSLMAAERSLAYDKRSLKDETDRTNSRNNWIKKLRESLKNA